MGIFWFELKVTYHKINHCRVYNSVAFSIFATLYNHHFYLVIKHLHPKRRPIPIPLPLEPGNYESAICLYSLPIWEISCKWNPTMHRHLCLASFTPHSIMFSRSIHDVTCISASFLFMGARCSTVWIQHIFVCPGRDFKTARSMILASLGHRGCAADVQAELGEMSPATVKRNPGKKPAVREHPG